MQNVLVVGDYFAEQAGVGLTQEVVERRQISRIEAAHRLLRRRNASTRLRSAADDNL